MHIVTIMWWVNDEFKMDVSKFYRPHCLRSSLGTSYHSLIASPASSHLHLSSKIYGVGIEPWRERLDGQIGLTQLPQVKSGLSFHFLSSWNDLIMNISKQTVAIVKEVAKKKPRTDWDCTYIPHGIHENEYKPITDEKEITEMNAMRKQLTDDNIEFIVFYNNRNIRRKLPGDIIMAYKHFCDQLPKEQAYKCCLLIVHNLVTKMVLIYQCSENNCTDYKVYFSENKLSVVQLNYLYNIGRYN